MTSLKATTGISDAHWRIEPRADDSHFQARGSVSAKQKARL
jgi:hypothetical protein